MEISSGDLEGEAMWAVPENVWKQRFISRLAQLFVQRGLNADLALAIAEAHADECYPQRRDGAPEQEADMLYRSRPVYCF